MKQRLTVCLIIFFALLFVSPGRAEVPEQAGLLVDLRIRGSHGLEFEGRQPSVSALRHTGLRVTTISPVYVSVRVPGLGRVQIKLTKVWDKNWPAFFTLPDGSRISDDSPVRLLRGTYRVKSRNKKEERLPAAANVILDHSEPKLQLTFRSRNDSSTSAYLYSIQGNLGTVPNTGRVTRTTEKSMLQYTCGLSTHHAHGGAGARLAVAPVQKRVGAATGARTVELATDADVEFYGVHGTNTNNVIAGIINSAQTVYDSTFNIDFTLTAQNSFVSAPQPYTSSDANTLLDQFQSHVLSEDPLGYADLYHLFTGKDIDGDAVGLAALGIVCKALDQRFAFTQRIDDQNEHLVFAHEVGHNFSATHDSTSGANIMQPSFSTANTAFSNQSIAEFENHLSEHTSCLGVEGESSLSLDFTATRVSLPAKPSAMRKVSGFNGANEFVAALVDSQGYERTAAIQILFRNTGKKKFKLLYEPTEAVTGATLTTNRVGEFQAKIKDTETVSKILRVNSKGKVKVVKDKKKKGKKQFFNPQSRGTVR